MMERLVGRVPAPPRVPVGSPLPGPLSGHRTIALVTHGFQTGGGVPSVTRWLRDGLEAQGEYVVTVHDLATSRLDPSSRRIAAPGSWLRPSLRSGPASAAPYQHWGANAVEIEAMRYRPRRELTAVLRGYDLVQVVAGSPAWAAPVVGCGRPVVLQVASSAAWERESQLSVPDQRLRRWRQAMTHLAARIETSAIRRADAVLVENDLMLEHVRAAGQPRAEKAPPGVDIDTFGPAASGWHRDGYLLSVCRLGDQRKGLDRMVRAYGELVQMNGSTPDLVLAGRGSVSPQVSRLIAQLGLTDRVSIRPDVPSSALADLYRQASVFLQTSHEEGLGISMLEAMACGLPVVATATHGARELVGNGINGWLLSQTGTDLPPAFAEKVRAVLDGNGGDLGQRGRQRCIAEFSTAICVRRFTEIYDALLSRQRVGTS